jgi:two-component system sensor histidine kinase KdpD
MLEQSFAASAFERNVAVRIDSLAGTNIAVLFLPLATASRVRGVLACLPPTDKAEVLRAHRPLLEAAASVTAMTVERLHSEEIARQVEAQIAAERLRNSTLASLSHDLRTPLTSLLGTAESLAQEPGTMSKKQAEAAHLVLDQARNLHRLVCDLLDLVRLQAGSQTLNRQWQAFEEVVGSSTRLLAATLQGHHVSLDIPAALPLVYFDAVLLERVLSNLLENAAKYSPAGSPIHVAAAARHGQLEVIVDNEGPGFPPDRLEEIFAPFVRGDKDAGAPGSGLGLAICKAIIEAHGGNIEADNLEHGARIQFTLPLGTPPQMPEDGAT